MIGKHTFIAASHRSRSNRQDYFLGSYVGDHCEDVFGAKLKRITNRLAAKFGWSGFTSEWSPVNLKPAKQLTVEQKYKRMVTVAQNKHKAEILAIFKDNSLFVDDFLQEVEKKYYIRLDQLKRRYDWPAFKKQSNK